MVNALKMRERVWIFPEGGELISSKSELKNHIKHQKDHAPKLFLKS
uniref:Uncharacterized protein n=1 Tax=Anguilla anguilla TaxID=7936 RepID=A0A0E9S6S5_ANGAN